MKLSDNEIEKALKGAMSLAKMIKSKVWSIEIYKLEAALDLINRLKAENDDLFYKLTGVMCSVDKWLEGDELKQDEVNRAAMMREKTLRITEEQQAEIERLNELLERENEKYVIAMTALKKANEEKAKLSKAIEESNEYFSEGDFVKGLAIVIGLSNTFAKLPHNSLCETETYEG